MGGKKSVEVDINISAEDCPDRFHFPELYSKSFGGKTRSWKISFDGEKIIFKHGQVDGKIREDERMVELKGSASLKEQALVNMRRKYINKQERAPYYASHLDAHVFPKMMKGNKLVEGKTRLKYPLYAQPKLDGIRVCFIRDKGTCKVVTYNGKIKTNLDHIVPHAMRLFSYLPGGCTMLDGELLHKRGIPLCELTSIFNSHHHDDVESLYYAIFDIGMADTVYEHRLDYLRRALVSYRKDYPHRKDRLIRSLQTKLFSSFKDLKKYHKHVLKYKYHGSDIEGIVIKKCANGKTEGIDYKSALYVSGKRNNIIKWKYSEDDEYEIIGFSKAKGNQQDAIVFRLKTKEGKEFKCVPKMTIEHRRELYKIRRRLIGEMATVRYKTLTPYGIPYHANVIAIRNYE